MRLGTESSETQEEETLIQNSMNQISIAFESMYGLLKEEKDPIKLEKLSSFIRNLINKQMIPDRAALDNLITLGLTIEESHAIRKGTSKDVSDLLDTKS